jgi:hypothetical protein
METDGVFYVNIYIGEELERLLSNMAYLHYISIFHIYMYTCICISIDIMHIVRMCISSSMETEVFFM